jgi:predicted lipoprotein with Yx(FWY)xxD motif
MSKRVALVLSLTVALALTAQVALADTMKPQLVRTIVDPKLGKVLTTGGRQAIYVWNKEPKGTIKCTGACAKAWPPVIVKTGVVVPMHVKGIMGEFGTVRRAGGARQLTFNRRALYTYAHESAGQVLCNNVDGWFAVKVHA